MVRKSFRVKVLSEQGFEGCVGVCYAPPRECNLGRGNSLGKVKEGAKQ